MKNPNTPTATTGAAKTGRKMITLRISFFTDEIASDKNSVIPKEAWDIGEVLMEANENHGIKPLPSKLFNSIFELPSKVAEVLTDHDITLHTSSKTKKLIKP